MMPRRGMAAWLLAAICLWLPAHVEAGDQPISGAAHVHDGDGIYIGEVAFRMWGIDAPELDQTCKAPDGAIVACGEISRSALEQIIGGRSVTCHPRGMTFDRILALCVLADGTDLSAAMTRVGYVFAYREYSLDYVAQEEMARIEGRYLWRLETISPAQWRRLTKAEKETFWSKPALPLSPASTSVSGGLAAETEGCRIKGNINREGRRLYHRPGDPWYARTKVDPEKGEAWFCSESDARAAGFSPAGG